ncbi:major facilitator superfamily domain-containing protein [Microdochium bolleyi]|uniref:Major facilitator superfamily domain-containing protein n=1 Tax=Microdochium bolleyi TaxID=196109 RepID=A0A136J8T6_9PEZI|nr:major facilitator superfamily domain-containing protein [Microdochium bolleyi]
MADHAQQPVAATEATPLLAASPIVPVLADQQQQQQQLRDSQASSSSATIAGDDDAFDSDDDADSDSPVDKPFPRTQVMLLCYARMVEPIAFFSIFPYINQMLLRNGGLAEADVGFYSGLIESLFSLTQMCVMMAWGRAADRFGRKPVLVGSLVGVSIATSLFGLATSIWQMILFRCISGVFAGTIVTIRVMITEHSTPKTQATSFSWFAFAGNMGIMVGPLLGGVLADPVSLYPGVFSGILFFEKYPYALSSFVVGFVGFTAVITSAFFIDETLPAELRSDSAVHAREGPGVTYRTLLRSPGVSAALYTYGHIMLLAFAYTAVVPVFWFTPPALGGFGFTSLQISTFMAVNGFSQAAWLLLVFPRLQARIGTNGVLRLCAVVWPFFFAIMPFLNTLLRIDTDTSRSAFWCIVTIAMLVGPGVAMAFTAVQLMLNDVAPDARGLSTLNAMALALMSGLRSFSPALFTSIFAFGAGASDWLLHGYLIWVIFVAMALGLVAYVYGAGLPEGEGKALGGAAAAAAPGRGGERRRSQSNKERINANKGKAAVTNGNGYGSTSGSVSREEL